jgi:hypothetical protein
VQSTVIRPDAEVVAALLISHSVQYQYRDGELWAKDVVVGPNNEDRSSWINVTDWSIARTMKWLGY